jgi:hypothetical protein
MRGGGRLTLPAAGGAGDSPREDFYFIFLCFPLLLSGFFSRFTARADGT